MSEQPHVLVVEDNELVCDAMRVLFEETGHRVSVAGHRRGDRGHRGVGSGGLLLLDLGLADGDGFEVLASLAAQGVKPRVIVALTGRDEPEIIARCNEAGCAAVLLKPVPARELLRITAELLAA